MGWWLRSIWRSIIFSWFFTIFPFKLLPSKMKVRSHLVACMFFFVALLNNFPAKYTSTGRIRSLTGPKAFFNAEYFLHSQFSYTPRVLHFKGQSLPLKSLFPPSSVSSTVRILPWLTVFALWQDQKKNKILAMQQNFPKNKIKEVQRMFGWAVSYVSPFSFICIK